MHGAEPYIERFMISGLQLTYVSQGILKTCQNHNKTLLKKTKDINDDLEQQRAEKVKVETENRDLNVKLSSLTQLNVGLEKTVAKLEKERTESLRANSDVLSEIDDKTKEINNLCDLQPNQPALGQLKCNNANITQTGPGHLKLHQNNSN